jgi:hypothetical protein
VYPARRPRLDVVACDVRPVVEDVVLSRYFFLALPFYPNSIIPLIIYTHFSLISVTSEEQEKTKNLKKSNILSDSDGQISEN